MKPHNLNSKVQKLQPTQPRKSEYPIAILFSIGIFVLLSYYLYLRRGFYDLYIANKIFAGVAAIQLGIVLLIGSLSRMFTFFSRYLKYRNEFGMLSFYVASIHVLLSLFFLSDHFQFIKYFVPLNIPFIFGLTGFIVLLFLFSISYNALKQLFSPRIWWICQYMGVRIVFILVSLHVFVMKYPSWISWYKQGGNKELVRPDWPGLGLLLGWFMLAVIVIRLSERVGKQFGRAMAISTLLVLLIIYIGTFYWGSQF